MLIVILSSPSESCSALRSLPAAMPGSLCGSSRRPPAPTHSLAAWGRLVHPRLQGDGLPKTLQLR